LTYFTMNKMGALVCSLVVLMGLQLPICGQQTIVAWGWNAYGQLDEPTDLTNVVAIATKDCNSLALTRDGTVVAWGTFLPMPAPSNLRDVIAISAGAFHGVALRANGTIVAWGNNYYGQTNIPVGLTNVLQVSAGFSYTAALKADGTVVTWGESHRGIEVPAGLSNVIAVSTGLDHTLALKRDGTVVAWGRYFDGLLDVPPGLTNVTAISAGQMHSLALKRDGTVVGWGSYHRMPMTVPPEATNIVAISAGSEHSLALRADGTIVGWSWQWNPQLGLATAPPGLPRTTAIAAGSYHSLVLVDGFFTNRPPVAICQDATGYSDDYCLAYELYVDGGSFDPDGNPITVSQSPDLPYPPGTNQVTLTVTDNLGASSSCTATVTVIDPTPPTLTDVVATPSVLSRRNQQMVPVRISANVVNACHSGWWKIADVQSSEPISGPGYGQSKPDWVITSNDTVYLRAESYGRNGRTYYVTVQAVNTLDQPVASHTIAIHVPRH
jgi:hypothetical protein